MEIERKWMVSGWPEGVLPIKTFWMAQGYLSTRPTVRIRKEAGEGETRYILCLKGEPQAGGLACTEVEVALTQTQFLQTKEMVGHPLIEKEQRRYALPGGLVLEVNAVDQGLPTAFFYAEVEFPTLDQARDWNPGPLAQYLSNEVTGQPGQSMAEYWQTTRCTPQTP